MGSSPSFTRQNAFFNLVALGVLNPKTKTKRRGFRILARASFPRVRFYTSPGYDHASRALRAPRSARTIRTTHAIHATHRLFSHAASCYQPNQSTGRRLSESDRSLYSFDLTCTICFFKLKSHEVVYSLALSPLGRRHGRLEPPRPILAKQKVLFQPLEEQCAPRFQPSLNRS